MKVSAPGKIILSGEHAVVYGYPALVAAINLRLSIPYISPFSTLPTSLTEYQNALTQLTHSIESTLPVGSGLGSSAALAVTQAAAFLGATAQRKTLDKHKINDIAYELEKLQHGTPSGVDNTISTYGGFLWYRKEHEKLKLFETLKPKSVLPSFLLLQSGTPEETTGEMVALVRENVSRNQVQFKKYFARIEEIAREMLNGIIHTECDWHGLLTENQELLEKIGVVSENTSKMVIELKKIGASAKITGAGGSKSGSGMLLVYSKNPDSVHSWASKKNIRAIAVQLGGQGLRIDR